MTPPPAKQANSFREVRATGTAGAGFEYVKLPIWGLPSCDGVRPNCEENSKRNQHNETWTFSGKEKWPYSLDSYRGDYKYSFLWNPPQLWVRSPGTAKCIFSLNFVVCAQKKMYQCPKRRAKAKKTARHLKKESSIQKFNSNNRKLPTVIKSSQHTQSINVNQLVCFFFYRGLSNKTRSRKLTLDG